jgi:ribosomal protein L7Ae-like RNA K-turn-binding protein
MAPKKNRAPVECKNKVKYIYVKTKDRLGKKKKKKRDDEGLRCGCWAGKERQFDAQGLIEYAAKCL